MVAPFTVAQFHHMSLPFEMFCVFLLLPGYNPNCRTQHTTESPLKISRCHAPAFQSQGTHKPFYSTCLQSPYLFSVESWVLNFQVSILSSRNLNILKIKLNCLSSLTPSPVNSPTILYSENSLLPLWFYLLSLSPLNFACNSKKQFESIVSMRMGKMTYGYLIQILNQK